MQMNTLRSWTDDEETRYFSGVATYEKEVTLTGTMFEKGRRIVLDFGEGQPNQSQPSQAGMQAMFDAPVREAAIVYINGQRAGSVWCPPYSLDVTSLLKPGPNKLRIEVSNTAINYMSGHSLPDYRLLNLRYRRALPTAGDGKSATSSFRLAGTDPFDLEINGHISTTFRKCVIRKLSLQ